MNVVNFIGYWACGIGGILLMGLCTWLAAQIAYAMACTWIKVKGFWTLNLQLKKTKFAFYSWCLEMIRTNTTVVGGHAINLDDLRTFVATMEAK